MSRITQLSSGSLLMVGYISVVAVWFGLMLVIPLAIVLAGLVGAAVLVNLILGQHPPPPMTIWVGIALGILSMGPMTAFALSIAATRRALSSDGSAPASLGQYEDRFGVSARIDGLLTQYASASRGNARLSFNTISITQRPEAYTAERRDGRELTVGLPLVLLLEDDELRAILAHECAHHLDWRMSLSRVTWRASDALAGLCAIESNPVELTGKWRLGPWNVIFITFAEWWLQECAVVVGMLISPIEWRLRSTISNIQHRYELECDRNAADLVGKEVYVRALTKAMTLSIAWDIYVAHWNTQETVRYSEFVSFLNSGVLLEFESIGQQHWATATTTHPSIETRARQLGVFVSDLGFSDKWRICVAFNDIDSEIAMASRASEDTEAHPHYCRAIALVHAKRERLEGLDETTSYEEVVMAVMVMLFLLPSEDVLADGVNAAEEPLVTSVIACLREMAKRDMIVPHAAKLRIRQIELSRSQRPARALRLLLGIWRTVRNPKAKEFNESHALCVSLFHSPYSFGHSVSWKCGTAAWSAYRSRIPAQCSSTWYSTSTGETTY